MNIYLSSNVDQHFSIQLHHPYITIVAHYTCKIKRYPRVLDPIGRQVTRLSKELQEAKQLQNQDAYRTAEMAREPR